MEASSKYSLHVYLCIVLMVTFSDSRHLTGRKSDAATRTSKSLIRSDVNLLGTPEGDPVARAVEKPKPDTHQVPTKAQNGLSGAFNQDVLQPPDVGTGQKESLHTHSNSAADSNKNLEEKTKSFASTNRAQIIEKNNPNVDETIAQDKSTESRISENERIKQESVWVTAQEERRKFVHANEPEVLRVSSEVLGDLNEKHDMISSGVTINSNTRSSKVEQSINADTDVQRSSTLENKPNQVSHEQILDNLDHDIQTDRHHIASDNPAVKQDTHNQNAVRWNNLKNIEHSDPSLTHTWDNSPDSLQPIQTHILNRNSVPDVTKSGHHLSNFGNQQDKRSSTDVQIQDFSIGGVSKKGNAVNTHRKAGTVSDNHRNTLRPRVTVFVEEKNKNGRFRRILAGSGDGTVQSHLERVNSDVLSHVGGSDSHTTDEKEKKIDLSLIKSQNHTSIEKDSDIAGVHNSMIEQPTAVLENVHDTDIPQRQAIEVAETNAESVHDLNTNAQGVLESQPTDNELFATHAPLVTSVETTTPRLESTSMAGEDSNDSWIPATDITPTEQSPVIKPTERSPVIKPTERSQVIKPTERSPVIKPTERSPVIKPTERSPVIKPTERDSDINPTERATAIKPTKREPEDVEPLNIFTNDIRYQRFPRPMSYTTLKNKVLGKPLKKLYILEETEKKLFQHVRQLEAVYTVEDEVLYVSFLFRFVFSRKCQEIQKFKMGKLVGNTDLAMFEKEMKDGKTERVLFFSERPEDYIFFMSCTDMNNSPYACRDSYYVTLDSIRDPPNQFPWGDAAQELESKLNLTFEDPRFIFNFVLLPCARTRTSS